MSTGAQKIYDSVYLSNFQYLKESPRILLWENTQLISIPTIPRYNYGYPFILLSINTHIGFPYSGRIRLNTPDDGDYEIDFCFSTPLGKFELMLIESALFQRIFTAILRATAPHLFFSPEEILELIRIELKSSFQQDLNKICPNNPPVVVWEFNKDQASDYIPETHWADFCSNFKNNRGDSNVK